MVRTSLADEPRDPQSLHDIVGDWKRQRWPGYAAPFITEECLCGGSITAENLWPKIAVAVLAHNQSQRHRDWLVESGWLDA